MDAQAIIDWSRSWGGTQLLYIDGCIQARSTDGPWQTTCAVAHSILQRWPQWFCCNDYRLHHVNYPADALLAYLNQLDPELCISTETQRRATDIAIHVLVRENYAPGCQSILRKQRNKLVIEAVERLIQNGCHAPLNQRVDAWTSSLANELTHMLELAYASHPLRTPAVGHLPQYHMPPKWE